MDAKLIETITKELFEKLQVSADFTIAEQDNTAIIKVNTEESGILIGYHGEALSALQLLISLIIYKKIGSWTRISLRVGDYVERREESLKAMAQRAVEKVIATKTPAALPFLRSDERRIIHLYLQDNPDVTSESEGEGVSRHLVIRPKT